MLRTTPTRLTCSMRPAVCAAAILVGIALSGCGSSAASSSQAAAAAQATAKAQAQAKATAAYQQCQTQLGPLLTAAQTLDGHLGVGMTYHDYTSALGDVNTAYEAVPFHQLEFACLSAGLPLEKALKEYVAASDEWTTCFKDVNCSNDSVKPKLQAHWAKATVLVTESKTAVDALQTPGAATTTTP